MTIDVCTSTMNPEHNWRFLFPVAIGIKEPFGYIDIQEKAIFVHLRVKLWGRLRLIDQKRTGIKERRSVRTKLVLH